MRTFFGICCSYYLWKLQWSAIDFISDYHHRQCRYSQLQIIFSQQNTWKEFMRSSFCFWVPTKCHQKNIHASQWYQVGHGNNILLSFSVAMGKNISFFRAALATGVYYATNIPSIIHFEDFTSIRSRYALHIFVTKLVYCLRGNTDKRQHEDIAPFNKSRYI